MLDFEAIELGFDIATAISIIGATIAFFVGMYIERNKLIDSRKKRIKRSCEAKE